MENNERSNENRGILRDKVREYEYDDAQYAVRKHNEIQRFSVKLQLRTVHDVQIARAIRVRRLLVLKLARTRTRKKTARSSITIAIARGDRHLASIVVRVSIVSVATYERDERNANQ